MRPGLPGGKVITVKREPCSGGAVPSLRAPQSSTSSPAGISHGVLSVDQISVEVEPAFPPRALVAGPSMITLATLFLSWPVTTRRIGGKFSCSAILSFSLHASARTIGATARPMCHYRLTSHAILGRKTMPNSLDEARYMLALANRMVAFEGVLDGFGHISVRHPSDPSRYLL